MAADGSLTFDTKLDANSFKAGLGKLGGALGSGLKSAGSAITSFAASATKTMVGFSVAGGAALAGASGYAINLASDLSEVQNVVDTTFGSNASQINSWSKAAATSFGLSELQAKQFTGTLGAMMKSMGLTDTEVLTMSQSMVGLAGDFASFYNLPTEEAFEKIRAGISGETEPLKQLGINMSVANLEAYALSQGIDKSYESMTQAEQATLRYNYLMSVSADAQGDFAKTSDSLANQMRIAKLEIQDMTGVLGEKMMPTAKEAFGVLTTELGLLKEALNNGGTATFFEQFGASIANITTYIAEKMPEFVNIGTQLFQSLIQGFINNYAALSGAIQQIVSSLISGYAVVIPMILQLGGMILNDIISGILTFLPNLGSVLSNIITTISTWITTNLPALILVGVQILTGIIDGITSAIPTLFAQMPLITDTIITALANSLPQLLSAGWQLIQTLGQGITDSLPELIPIAVDVCYQIVNYLLDNIGLILDVGIDILTAIIDGIISAIPMIVETLPRIIIKIVDVLSENLPKVLNAGIKILNSLIQGIIACIPTLLEALPKIIKALVEFFVDNLPLVVDTALQIIVALAKGLIIAIPLIVKALPEIIMAIVDGIGAASKAVFSVGKDIIKGLWNGIKSAKDWLWGKISSFFGGFVDGIKEFFGIASPSKLFENEIGNNLIFGIEDGITGAARGLYRTMDDVIGKIQTEATIGTSIDANVRGGQMQRIQNQLSDYAVSNNSGSVFNFYQPVESPAEIARRIKLANEYGMVGI